jgi:hypothetical protein
MKKLSALLCCTGRDSPLYKNKYWFLIYARHVYRAKFLTTHKQNLLRPLTSSIGCFVNIRLFNSKQKQASPLHAERHILDPMLLQTKNDKHPGEYRRNTQETSAYAGLGSRVLAAVLLMWRRHIPRRRKLSPSSDDRSSLLNRGGLRNRGCLPKSTWIQVYWCQFLFQPCGKASGRGYPDDRVQHAEGGRGLGGVPCLAGLCACKSGRSEHWTICRRICAAA